MSQTRTLSWEKTGSWARAKETGIIIKPRSRAHFVVRLTDSADGHTCSLVRTENGDYQGHCGCRGFRYHGQTCAHLWALRISEGYNAVEIPTETELHSKAASCPQCGRQYDDYREAPREV